MILASFILLTIVLHSWSKSHSLSTFAPDSLSLSSKDCYSTNYLTDSPKPRANSTLGFEKILYMNVATRYDLDDAMTLQSAISGIDITKVDAIPLADLGKQGMPPTSSNDNVFANLGVVSCFATHAKLWKKMLSNDWQTMLIFEADSAWDIEIRRQFAYMSDGIYKMLLSQNKIDPSMKPTSEDPYLHKHWDIIQFGGCFENQKNSEQSVTYDDPYAQINQTYVDGTKIQDGKRVIRFRGEQMCTTAYAITRPGAQKLVLRTALDYNTPADGIMAELVREGKIDQFSLWPTPVIQWKYSDKLPISAKNSEINKFDENEPEASKEVWDQVKEDMCIWRYNGMHKQFGFLNCALLSFKKSIYGNLPNYS